MKMQLHRGHRGVCATEAYYKMSSFVDDVH